MCRNRSSKWAARSAPRADLAAAIAASDSPRAKCDLGERRVGFRSPRRVARQDVHELLGVLRRSFGQREQLLVGAIGAEQRRLQGEPGERLAACRGASLLRREANRPLEMLAHPLGVSCHGACHSTRGIELAGAEGSRVDGRCLRGTVEPPLRLLDLPQLEVRQGEARGRGELERPVSQQTCLPVSLLAPRVRGRGRPSRGRRPGRRRASVPRPRRARSRA